MRLLILLLIFLFGVYISFSQDYRSHKIAVSYQPSYVMLDYISTHFLFPQTLNVTYSPFDHFSFNINASTARGNYRTSNYKNMEINDKSLGLSINYHRKKKQSFAPSGNYVGIKFDIGFQNGTTKEYEYEEDCYSCSPKKILFYDERERQKMYVASVVFGRNFILKERFLIGYGIQWGLVIEGGRQPMRNMGKPFFNLGIVL